MAHFSSPRKYDGAKIIGFLVGRLRHPFSNGHHAKTTAELLANLEHEFRLLGNPIWLGAADGEHEFDIQLFGCRCRLAGNIMAGGSRYWRDYPALDWASQRPDVDAAGPPAAFYFSRSHSCFAGVNPNAQLSNGLDGSGTLVGFGRNHQCFDATIPGLGGR